MESETVQYGAAAAQPLPVDAVAQEAAPIPAIADEPTPAGPVAAWFAEWFPEASPPNHPVPYLTGAWHHVRAAVDDLKQRLSAA